MRRILILPPGHMTNSRPGTMVIDVRVIPRATQSHVAGVRDGALIVRLKAPPVEGAANRELIRIMAATFDIPKRAVAIVRGERSRYKRVRLVGIDSAGLHRKLGSIMESDLLMELTGDENGKNIG